MEQIPHLLVPHLGGLAWKADLHSGSCAQKDNSSPITAAEGMADIRHIVCNAILLAD